MTKRQWIFAVCGAAMAAAAVAVGCSGGSSGKQAVVVDAEKALNRGVRVGIRFVQPAARGYLSQLTAAEKQEAAAAGYTLEETRIVYPPVPIAGYYLKIGSVYIPGGPDGEFFIPEGLPVPASVPVFKQRLDKTPIATINIAGSLGPGTSTLKSVYFDILGHALRSASVMDGVKRGRAAKACCAKRAVDDGCNRVDCDVTSNVRSEGCCYDFDATKGRITGTDEIEPEDGTNLCIRARISEWWGSECQLWTTGAGTRTAACWNEGAYWQVAGPSCYDNHKYRYCQNMNGTDLTISGQGTVTVTTDKTYTVTVHNNTAGNETNVSQSGDANGAMQPGAGITVSPGGTFSSPSAVIQHYDDTAKGHVNDRALTYKAPADLPDNKKEAFDTLTFTSGGQTRTLTIRVVKPCGENKARGEQPCG